LRTCFNAIVCSRPKVRRSPVRTQVRASCQETSFCAAREGDDLAIHAWRPEPRRSVRPKPELTKNSGKEYKGDVQYSFVNRANKSLFGSPWKFAKHGKCGTDVSELLPHTAGIVDDIT